MKKNIILIGMPGAGKSTVGILLAKDMAMDFVDTDILIQVREDKPLQDILDQFGYMALREIEQDVLLAHDFANQVVATGGSAVYSEKGMQKLKSNGVAVFLEVDIAELDRRIHNYETRGIAKRPDQSFEALFEERHQLYKKYADITINANQGSPSEIATTILEAIKKNEQVEE